MPRNKKAKGSTKGAPKHPKPDGHASTPKSKPLVPDPAGSLAQNGPPFKTFTLRDAARNDRQGSVWTPNANLRHKTMSFVKSGNGLEGTGEAQTQLGTKPSTGVDDNDSTCAIGNASLVEETNTSCTQSSNSATVTQQPRHRSMSPSGSDTSEEVIFTGRNQHLRPLESASPAPSFQEKPNTPSNIRSGEQKLTADLQGTRTDSPSGHDRDYTTAFPSQSTSMPDAIAEQSVIDLVNQEIPGKTNTHVFSIDDPSTMKSMGPNLSLRTRPKPQMDSGQSLGHDRLLHRHNQEEEILHDYIENMKNYGIQDEENEEAPTVDEAKVKQRLDGEIGGWTRSDIEDLADLSTSDEVLAEVSDILAKRYRSEEVQYLVVWAGHLIDDARWVRQSALLTDGAKRLIESFESEERQVAEYQAQYAEDTDDDDDDENVEKNESADDGQDDEWEDEDEEFDSGLSDAQIARLLAKQEELGMGSDQLLIIDDRGKEPDSEYWRSTRQPHGVTSRPTRSRRERKQKWRAGEGVTDDDDALFGSENYDGFDVMDWDRPSLERKRHDLPEFDLSDSDLEQKIRDSWSKDRQKKKAIKEEREDLRAQGLLGLGKKSGQQSLAAKYRNGFTLEQLRNDFADFLDGGREQLELPPLDKKERKLIHEVANAFNCKSKSNGSGKNRYPVIYKTRRSLEFEDRLFDRVERKLGRKALGGPMMRSKPARPGRSSRGGGGVNGGFNYREGETVGAGASEIGSENRGRAMLEKMGWSKGTALGAINNKGILMPIEHVVKNSRAGLG